MSYTQHARPELPKRFYKSAAVVPGEGGFAVTLDARPVKTPSRKPLAVPRRPIAEAIAAEWEAQGDRIDPGTMPMTRLVNTIVDSILPDPEPVRADLWRFAETDLLFYRAGEPAALAERQRERWDPILDFAQDRLGVRFALTEGVMHVAQPPEAIAAYAAWTKRLDDPFALAGLHQATTLTGSALLAFALAEGRISAPEAWTLSLLDEDWNIEQWGADEEAMALRAARWQEMAAAGAILSGE